MVIFNDDYEKHIDPLPIRRGCSGMCACSGICREIIGTIPFDEYDSFIKNFISVEDFLKQNMNNVVEKIEDKKIAYISIKMPPERFTFLSELKSELYKKNIFIEAPLMVRLMREDIFSSSDEIYKLYFDNKEIFDKILEKYFIKVDFE